MKPSEILLTAKNDYIARGWTQFAVARTAEGHKTEPESSDATSWCAAGSVEAAVCSMSLDQILASDFQAHGRAIDFLFFAQNRSGGSIGTYNDEVLDTQQEALDWFDAAIRLAKDAGE